MELFFRKFGHSTRFSQSDKNDMAKMLAVKLEADRVVMHSVRQKLEMELNMEKRRRDEADKVFSDISKSLTEFITQHKSQLETHSHGMLSTSNFLLLMAKLMSGGNVGALV